MDFNEMVRACWEAAKEFEASAYLLVAESPAGLKFTRSVFHGVNNTSIIVACDSQGDTKVQEVDSPYMDCLPIKVPAKISQEESLTYLYDAHHGDDWESVTFRKPLGPVPYNTLYIYTYSNERTGLVTYWAVDSTDGSVFQLF
ncbi:MAG: hypothetical protein ACPHGY_03110 [Rhodospirillaceae bacterium]